MWTIAERFGWTLDYIDSLPLERLHEFFQIEDGRAKAETRAPQRKPKVR